MFISRTCGLAVITGVLVLLGAAGRADIPPAPPYEVAESITATLSSVAVNANCDIAWGVADTVGFKLWRNASHESIIPSTALQETMSNFFQAPPKPLAVSPSGYVLLGVSNKRAIWRPGAVDGEWLPLPDAPSGAPGAKFVNDDGTTVLNINNTAYFWNPAIGNSASNTFKAAISQQSSKPITGLLSSSGGIVGTAQSGTSSSLVTACSWSYPNLTPASAWLLSTTPVTRVFATNSAGEVAGTINSNPKRVFALRIQPNGVDTTIVESDLNWTQPIKNMNAVGEVLADYARVWVAKNVNGVWQHQIIVLPQPADVQSIGAQGIADTGDVWGLATDARGRSRPAIWVRRVAGDGTISYDFFFMRELLQAYLPLDLSDCWGIDANGSILVSGYSKPNYKVYRLRRLADANGDGIPDSWADAHRENPNTPLDAQSNTDNDGLNALSEYLAGTDPNLWDTDGDGIKDGWEVQKGYDPRNAADGMWDLDGDHLTTRQEFLADTDPSVRYDVIDLNGAYYYNGLGPRALAMNSPAAGQPLTIVVGEADWQNSYISGARLRLALDYSSATTLSLPYTVPAAVSNDGAVSGTYYEELPGEEPEYIPYLKAHTFFLPANATSSSQERFLGVSIYTGQPIYEGDAVSLDISPDGSLVTGLYNPPPDYLGSGFIWDLASDTISNVFPADLPATFTLGCSGVANTRFAGDSTLIGSFYDATASSYLLHGFSLVNNAYQLIEDQLGSVDPNAFAATVVNAGSSQGDIAFTGYTSNYTLGADSPCVLVNENPKRVGFVSGLGGTDCFLTGINDEKRVVGTASTPSGVQHGFTSTETNVGSGMWHSIDLNALISGTDYEITEAITINNRGDILAHAIYQNFTNEPPRMLLLRPTNGDLDGDGWPDDWEVAYFGNTSVFNGDGTGDYDEDGLTDLQEYELRTNPNSSDTDGDGSNDAAELAANTSPTDPAPVLTLTIPSIGAVLTQ